MISPAIAIVQLNGKTYRELKSIEISQSVNDHHYFSISIGSGKIGELANSFLEKARDFVGTDMTLEIHNGLKEKLVFRGIITRVKSAATSRSELGHTVIMEGYSPTILLDNGKNCQSYIGKNLKSIAEEVCRDFPVNVLNPEISPMKKDTISYTVQYQESAFSFLNRLACRYGEWFYFDGKSLVFGNKKQPDIELLYGTDLLSFDIGLSVAPLVQSVSSRIYKEDSTHVQNMSGQKTTMKGMASFAMDKSAKTFLGKPVSILHQFDDESAVASQMDEVSRLTIQSEAARRVTFSGVSINPALYPGAIISVNNLTGRGKAKQGEYIVTSVTHTWSSGGQYQNSFTAIPSDAEVPPMTNPLLVPFCESQSAIVTDNNDPEGLGRVKVRFSWQKYGDTPWLRIAMPYGGPNKGIYFVPETDEEVMVGFEGGNAEKPYVQGTLYHAKAKPDDWHSESNDLKAIRTRSGHTIEFNDSNSDWGITIKDKNDNCIFLDTSGKGIKISAPEKISLVSNDIEIIAKNQLILKSEKDTNQSVGTEFNQSIGGDASIAYSKNLKTSVGSDLKLNVGNGAEIIVSGEYVQNVQDTLKISSGDKMEVIAQSDMTLKSGSNVYISE